MKNITPWFLLLSLLMGAPAFALAEEGAGTTDTSAVTIETTSVETGTETNAGKPLPPKPRPAGGIPPKPEVKNMMEKRMIPGNTGSGTPKLPPAGLKDAMKMRMENGTSGKPAIPPGIKDRIMNASGTRPMMGSGTRPFASGTPKMLERMKLLKDGKMDRKMDAAKEFIKGATERMENAIERLEKLSSRLDEAVAKMKEKGVDTTNAEGLLATAKTKIGEAKTAVANALATIEAAKPSSTGTSTGQIADGTRQAVKDALEKAKVATQAAHKALVEAVAALKAQGGVRTGQGSGTGTTTP